MGALRGVCSKPRKEHGARTDHDYQRNTVLPEWHGWLAFRRGCATNLHRLGVDDWTIAEILGHEDVMVTRKNYIKADNEKTQAAMEMFQAKLDSLSANQVPTKSKVQVIKGVM